MYDFLSPDTITSFEFTSSNHTSMMISVVFFTSTSRVNTSHWLNQVSGVLISTQRGDETIEIGGVGTLRMFL